MSGVLPPRTAVSTFWSVSSLLTYRLSTFWPGCCAWYSDTRCEKVLASAPVKPSQIWIGPEPADDPPLASVPQPDRATATAVSAVISPAVGPRRRCFVICVTPLDDASTMLQPILN
jgi:hypothetical protein